MVRNYYEQGELVDSIRSDCINEMLNQNIFFWPLLHYIENFDLSRKSADLPSSLVYAELLPLCEANLLHGIQKEE